MYHGASEISEFVPNDSSRQSSSEIVCEKILKHSTITKVMDLGCGEGNSFVFFKKIKPDIEWIGVDIENSTEGAFKKKEDANFITYDGINIPFNNDCFDLIYCNQVLEHVKQLHSFLGEVCRTLKPGGYFVGSTSHLEAFHSLSICNFTPFGLRLFFEEASLSILELRPGIDVFTLMMNRFLGRIPILGNIIKKYFVHEPPFNHVLGILGWIGKKSHREINLLKLLFCGHFVFVAQKKELTLRKTA